MSLLQDPNKALDQIDWYLTNRTEEKFPGAFLLAAGNLARQLVEQIVFILAFYSRLPQSKYLRSGNRLRVLDDILKCLAMKNPTTGRTYFEEARLRGPRIRKFARHPRSLDTWRRRFNEPSHFRNPAAKRTMQERHIREFVRRLRAILDSKDPHLITAAVNELRSGGRIRAVLSNNTDNTPGIQVDSIVGPSNFVRRNGALTLEAPKFKFCVVSNTHEIPHHWRKIPVVVQHSVGISIGTRIITVAGDPVNLSNLGTIIKSLGKTSDERERLSRRFRQLGYTLSWKTK